MLNRRDFMRDAVLANLGLFAGQGWASDALNKGQRIKVAQFGICHEHAQGKIETLRKLPDVFDVVGYVDDRETSKIRFNSGGLKPYEGLRKLSADELLNYPGLQLATVEVANSYLLDAAFLCMRHNLAMHMDKPPCQDLAKYRELLNGCEARKLPFQMGYMLRTNPAIRFCIKAVREGLLGDIYEIKADMSHNYGNKAYQVYLSNFQGGIMYNLGCHLIDVIVSMLGRPEKVTPFLKSTPGAVNNAKDNCAAVLEYPHTLVTLSANGMQVKRNNPRSMVICGSKGTIVLAPLESFGSPNRVLLELKKADGTYQAGSQKIEFPVVRDRYEGQLRELAGVIRGEITNPYTFAHDALVLEVTLAASGVLS